MKKLLQILGVIFILSLSAMIFVPYLFKYDIKQIIVDTANENLNAKVDFDDIGINLFSSFPNFSVSIKNLSIVNHAPFDGDTVISAGSVNLSVDVLSLIIGNIIKVNSIFIDSPKAIIYILKDGSVNYKWTKETEPEEKNASADVSKSKLNVELQEYTINNGKFAFIDQTSDMVIAVNELNHSGRGDFTSENFLLDTKTSIEALTIELKGIKYLNQVNTELDMMVDVNIPNMTFNLNDNKLRLNNFILMLDGSVQQHSDKILLDIKFSSPRSEFKDIISLIPAIYKNDFSNIKSSGTMEFTGKVNGQLVENKLPQFNLNFSVNNGQFQFPNHPTEVKNVNLELNITNTNGEFDNTLLKLSNIYMELGSDPIEGMLVMKNLETGPNIKTKVKGKINLENIRQAFELKDIIELKGLIESDFEFEGNISSVRSNNERLKAKGKIHLKDIIYQNKRDNQKINLANAELNFTPKDINLKNFKLLMGKSDLEASGNLNNLISYALSNGRLSGELNLKSKYFNLNHIISKDYDNEVSSDNSERSTSAFDIPKNIIFNLSSRFDQLIFDNLDLKNVKGDIEIEEAKISLKNLNMDLLNGSLIGSGYYAKTEYQENPNIEFNLNLKKLDINQTYDKFLSVRQFTPIAKFITGYFSSNIKLNTRLDNTLTPIWNTFFSNGMLDIKSAEIKNFKPFVQVGDILKLDELSNPRLQNVKPRFEIKNGRFSVSPFELSLGNTKVVLSGSNGLDQSIDYTMDIKIPAEKIKKQANMAIRGLLGKDLNLIKSNTIDIQANIVGTIDSPKIRTSASNVATDAASQVKNAVIAEVKSKTDSLKNEAEQKLKEEAKKKEEELKKKEEEIKKQLEEEAKKKIKKLFGFG